MLKKSKFPLLKQVVVDSPCPMKWEQLDGNDTKRFCGHCQKHVHNFSAMRPKEVEQLMASDQHVCARILRHADGTVVTKERKLSRRAWLSGLGSISAAVALLFGFGGCNEQPVKSKKKLHVPPDDLSNGPWKNQNNNEPVVPPNEHDLMLGGIGFNPDHDNIGGASANPKDLDRKSP